MIRILRSGLSAARAAVLAAAALAPGVCAAQANVAGDGNAAAGAAERPDGPIVPVHHEPHHRQVFQYGPVRILDLQIPPGDRSWYHTHEWPVLYMTLSQSASRIQNLGSDWSGGGAPRRNPAAAPGGAAGAGQDAPARAAPPRPAGGFGAAARRAPRATSTTSYVENPVTHRLENVGDGLFRAMVVVNETAGNEASSVEAAGFDAEPELTNPWFRSYRVTLEPGAATATHRHETPVVIFQATEGTGMASGPMSFEFNEPGQWAYYDTGAEHTIRNVGDGAIELLEIEVRLADQ